MLGNPELGESGVAALQEIITETGALQAVEELIDRRLADALAALDAAPLTAEATAVLHALAVSATQRSR